MVILCLFLCVFEAIEWDFMGDSMRIQWEYSGNFMGIQWGVHDSWWFQGECMEINGISWDLMEV